MADFFHSLGNLDPPDSVQLLKLDLHDTDLSDDCLKIISDLLNDNRCLSRIKTLHLGRNKFSVDCVEGVLLPVLRKNVEVLYLDTNSTTKKIREEIEFIFEVNKGGRRYLKKRDDGRGKACPVALWPSIFSRLFRIYTKWNMWDCDMPNDDERSVRVLYYLLTNGAMADICVGDGAGGGTREMTKHADD